MNNCFCLFLPAQSLQAGKLIMEQVEQWFEAWRFGPPGRGASAGNSADVSNGRGSGRSERERVDEEEGGGDSHAATGSERVGRQQEVRTRDGQCAGV